MRQADKIIREKTILGTSLHKNRLTVANSNYLNFTKFMP